MKRILSVLLSCAMALSMAIAPSYAASDNIETQLASGLYVHQNSFYSTYAEGDINENYFEYSPNTACTPYLAYGSDVAGAATISRIFRLEEEAGNSLVAVTNGDYFTVANGVPMGIEIKDGVIYSSSSFSFPEIGFTADGKARIGRSNLIVSLVDDSQDISINDVSYNKGLSDVGGLSIFSRDFGNNNVAKTDGEALNVLIKIASGSATANGAITGTIENIYTSTGRQSLTEGYLLATIYKSSYVSIQNQINTMAVGDSVSVHFTMDQSWENVTQAFGGKEVLMENGDLKTFSDNTRAPRTAFGIKADGTVVIYTCDGRGAGGSKGLTLTEVARRMKQLGCTNAVNLDGGGSTQAHVVFPGNTNYEQINVDSGTTLRAVGNYICFKNNLPVTGEVSKLYAYPNKYKLSAESSVTFNIKAVDSNWHAVDISAEDLTFKGSSLGSINAEGIYTAGAELGDDVVTVSCGKASIDVNVKVVSDWPELDVYYQTGKVVASITDPTGDGIPTSRIRLTLDGEDLAYTYSDGILSAEIPEIDGLLHHLILEAKSESGHITRKGLSFKADSRLLEDGTYEDVVSELEKPFTDMADSRWSTPYAEYLYREGIITGSEKNGLRYYNPDKNMTRQEFAKVVVSWLGVDTALYEETELEFTDNSKIASWAEPSVKAAVSLGIMGGKSNGTELKFDPEGSITRQEVMTVIGKILGDGYGKADLSDYADNGNVAAWASNYVKTLVKLNVITGSNGNLNPTSPVTREQVAKIIFEMN